MGEGIDINIFKLNEIIKIKSIVPEYPSHLISNIISNRLTYKTIEGRISLIDNLTYTDKIMYGIRFDNLIRGELYMSENDLLGIIIKE